MDIKNEGNIKSHPLKINNDYQIFQWLNKSVPILMGIFIFFNPFPHITSIKEICFYLSVFIVFILLIFKKKDLDFKTPFMFPVGLFVCWAFIGLFFALDKKNSIHDFYSHLIRYIILYYIIINFFRSKKCLIIFSWIILISVTIFSVGMMCYFYFILGAEISQRFGIMNPIFIQTPVNVIGILNLFATIICINILFSETKFYRKTILIICLFSILFSIVLSRVISTLAALCFAVIIIFSNNKKILIASSLLILIIVFLTPFKDRLVSYCSRPLIAFRVGINYQTYEIIKDYPIIGIGFGMETYKNAIDLEAYHNKVPEKYREIIIYDDPHNMFFDIAVRLGIIGLFLFFYIIVVFFKLCWDIIKYGEDDFIKNWGRCLAAALFSFLFIGFFHPVFSHMPETILCTIFSMLTIVWRLNKKLSSESVV